MLLVQDRGIYGTTCIHLGIDAGNQLHSFIFKLLLQVGDILHRMFVHYLRGAEHIAVCPVCAVAAKSFGIWICVHVHARDLGHLVGDRHEAARCSCMWCKPEHAPLPIAFQLHDFCVCRPEDTDGPLPIANDLLTLLGHVAVRVAERSGRKAFGQVVLCALIVAAVCRKEILDREEARCWDGRWVHFVIPEVVVSVWQVDAPNPVSIPHTVTTVVFRCVLAVTVGGSEIHHLARHPPAPLLSN
mmetsp:Transcript_27729/g.53489  ORF Transcript_27729/g.53489 Transcript_27729/m.53489 type:complete len:243 (-) Transcript_27729:869-1597(-)